ncbi:uncharacterized protein [Spinacia oleracea]|uniref:Uncharacterized protein n=1 Tax=Spinacia oleracea TaxID=3562 RepID=A0ABM3QQB3_SPIOL|nr:uncharacterized protein LOC130461459 [Spinacia oleracea]
MVDATAGHELLTFMDAYSGYNQILMYPEDQEKTSFVTDRGNYCYKVMPFGLKNAGATYQRLVNRMFKDQLGDTMEVYIDDMLVKSKKANNHVEHLRQSFEILRKYGMKLNPTKCSFGVSAGFSWTDDHETALQNLKKYLMTPPRPPVQTQRRRSPATLPRRQHDSSQCVTAAKKLRHYFETHQIVVMTNYPIKSVMRRPELTGRMEKWTMALGGFDIKYQPRTAVKSQALADFVADFSPDLEKIADDEVKLINNVEETWTLFVEGSSNFRGAGLGVVLKSPQGDMIAQEICCDFKATNNEAEYEALIAGMTLAGELGASGLNIFSDSQLIVNQINDDYEAKDLKMTLYLEKDVLFKRSANGMLMRCAEKVEWEGLLKQYHEGECGGHEGGRSLSTRIKRNGYYWPAMLKDAMRFGIPSEIICDNGSQFISDKTRAFCKTWNIELKTSTPRYPQANGQAESSNKTSIASLKKRLDDKKGRWEEELPSILWANRTTPRTATRQTPFSLVYGCEAVLPPEVTLPSARYGLMTPEQNDVELSENLDNTEDFREAALIRMASQQQIVAKCFNKNVKVKMFKEGDWVLCKVFQNTNELNACKLAPAWEGPYLIDKIVGKGAYRLVNKDGKSVPRSWNATHLKLYHF